MCFNRSNLSSGCLRYELAAQKLANGRRNLAMVSFQSEVPGVIEMHFRGRNITLERFRARGEKERIVFAPHRQHWRLFRAEIFLELGIERHVSGLVQKQDELNFIISGPS